MSISLRAEVQGADFGDKRLSDRLELVAEELGANPNLSIPAATFSRAEMEAAYRFFDNDKVSPTKILEPHFNATKERISQEDFVLLVQDTSELDLTRPNQQVKGAGLLDSESRRGAFMHPLHAYTMDRLPLGMVWQKTWIRSTIETDLTPKEKQQRRSKKPIEDKESVRWLEGLRAAGEVSKACPGTTCVCVGDSESDIYEFFSEPRESDNLDLLVRACQSRSLVDGGDWFVEARATSCLYECTVNVSARVAKIAPSHQGKRSCSRDARVAQVEIKAATVTLRPPWRFDRKLSEVTVNVVLVEETNPPEGCEPIQWTLVTTLSIDELVDVQRIVKAYCVRWQIEIFFRTLKSGCRIQKRLFEEFTRLENCLAVYSIAAWRVMYLCYVGRECPDMCCETVFEPCEWKAVYVTVKRKAPGKTPPTLNEIIRMIASLGGYVPRTKTNPGTQTLWIGLQRAYDLATAWNAFGPDS